MRSMWRDPRSSCATIGQVSIRNLGDPRRMRATLDQAGPTEADGDRLAKVIRNEVGRTFWATGGEVVSGDDAFSNLMARAAARYR